MCGSRLSSMGRCLRNEDRLNSEKKKGENEEATLELLRDLWLTTLLTVPTASDLSSLRMRFRDGGT